MITIRKNLLTMLLLLGLGLTGLTSCSGFEDGPGISLRSKKGRMTGTWDVTNFGGTSLNRGDLVWEFEKDGEWVETELGTPFVAEWSIEDGTTLQLTAGTDRVTYEILRLSNSEMRLQGLVLVELEKR